MSKVSIVIPNWNGAKKLESHLPFVLKSAKKNKIDEIIICDDASTDESLKVLKNKFPEVKVISHKKNLGFSSNVNSGVRIAKGDFIVLLNSDAHPEENFMKHVLPHFDDPKVFSVSLNSGGNWAWAKFKDGYFWHYQVDPERKKPETHQTLWASGGGGVFRKRVWDHLGGFDPLFNPFYEEDVDLGYRATKRGYKNIWEVNSKVEHYKEVGVIASHFKKDTISRIAQRNQLIFIWKNITSEKLFSEHKVALGKMILKHPKYLKIFSSALSNLNQIKNKRRKEQSESKLSDEEIFSIFS